MARAALNWTIRDLAEFADVATSTINHFEKGRHVHEKSVDTILATFLKTEEIQFVAEQGVFHVKKKHLHKLRDPDTSAMGGYKFSEGETMEPIQKALGLKIRRLREERSISQQTLVLRTDINKSYMYLLETGAANPTLLVLVKIAYALDISLIELITDIE